MLNTITEQIGTAWLQAAQKVNQKYAIRKNSKGFSFVAKFYPYSDTLFKTRMEGEDIIVILPKNSIYSGQVVKLTPANAILFGAAMGSWESSRLMSDDCCDYPRWHAEVEKIIAEFQK